MKKLLLVAAIGVAGLVSANNKVEASKEEPKKQKTEIIEFKKESKLPNEMKEEVKNVAVWGCLIISYDCGTKGISCGETLSEIIEQALNGYDFMCSDVEP